MQTAVKAVKITTVVATIVTIAAIMKHQVDSYLFYALEFAE